jgi:hypothetical protein
MGGSESTIQYQKDIGTLFPAGEINLDDACEVVKCTPVPKNTIEDFNNFNKNNKKKNKILLRMLLIIFLLLYLFFFHIT